MLQAMLDGMFLSKSECILKLQEDFIHEWEKQLWSDTRKMGGNKLRLYSEFKSTFAWENYLSWGYHQGPQNNTIKALDKLSPD